MNTFYFSIIAALLAMQAGSAAEFTVDSLRKDVTVMVSDLKVINQENAKAFITSHMNPVVVAYMEKTKDIDAVAIGLATDAGARDQLLKALTSIDYSKAVIEDKAKAIVIPSENVPSKKMKFIFIEKRWYMGD